MENRFTKFEITIKNKYGTITITIRALNDYEYDFNSFEENKDIRDIKLEKLSLRDYRVELETFMDKIAYLFNEVIK